MFGTFLTAIPQNLDFPHFQLFQIFAHMQCILNFKQSTGNKTKMSLPKLQSSRNLKWNSVWLLVRYIVSSFNLLANLEGFHTTVWPLCLNVCECDCGAYLVHEPMPKLWLPLTALRSDLSTKWVDTPTSPFLSGRIHCRDQPGFPFRVEHSSHRRLHTRHYTSKQGSFLGTREV